MSFHTKKIDACLQELQSARNGLSLKEAEDRLFKNGPNVLPEKKKKNKFVKFIAQFADIMIIILLIASAISITVAVIEKTYSEMVDGFIILGIVLINATLGFVQELKAEKDMKALLKLSEPEAKVLRGGELLQIHSSAVVAGDIVVLEAGDIICADIRFIETISVKCDESSLTGESDAVSKNAETVFESNTPLGDRKNMGYKGSVITNGRAVGVVVATASGTELGKIATLLNQTEKEDTPLQKGIKSVGKIITLIVLLIASITFILEVLARPGESVIEAFLTAVAISVAAIPESLPAVITIIMSMGVSRLSKRKAIVKRLHAVETLGSTEIICSDKTGTLTQNEMTVISLFFNNSMHQKTEPIQNNEFATLVKTMVLCNDGVKTETGFMGDPTETALLKFATEFGFAKHMLEIENKRIGEIPFDSNRKLMTTANASDNTVTCYTKGAPDIVLRKCTKILINGKIVELNPNYRNSVLQANTEMGNKALRVLGFAIKQINVTPQNFSSESLKESELVFVGLAGMMDPPRPEVFAAVKKCKKAHMLPIMITGDHKNTAFAVAKEVGIAQHENQVLTGAELDLLSETDFLNVINKIKVYARVSPQNKVRIVETFKKMGKIVAMTGDGVNDAPSLKMADIGVGMGITGTDVTKEVADLIVADDNFATIIIAVEEGRRIYANIKKTVSFLFSANLAEILSLFFATIIWPHLSFLLPVQILFVNLITDSLPAIALGLEPPESNLMEKYPRRASDNLFSHGVGSQIVFMGIVQTILVLTAFIIGFAFTKNNTVATTMAFYTLNIIQLFYLLSMRVNGSAYKVNPFKNKWILYAVLLAVSIFMLTIFSPLGAIIGLVGLNALQWLCILVLSFLIFPLSEFIKKIIKLNRTVDDT